MKKHICIISIAAIHIMPVQAQVLTTNNLATEWNNGFSKSTVQQTPFVLSKVHILKPEDLLLKKSDVNVKLQKQMDDIRALCPLLQAPISIELDADRKSDANALLNWKTENALYSRQYMIERSYDDTLHFETVNYVWPKSEYASREKYDMDDPNNYNRVSYYRVKLELHSGEKVYSNVAEVKGYTAHKMAVYPNPARDFVNIMAYEDADKIVGVKITDAAGKVVWKKNSLKSKQFLQEQVNVSGFSSGMYLVKFELIDNSKRTMLFMKQ